jgi:hypothetical protein
MAAMRWDNFRACEAMSGVIPGMNAIAFTREMRAIFGAPRRVV